MIWNFVSERAGFHLLYLQIMGTILSSMLKLFFALPRPYDVLPTVKILGTSGYGFPSGAATAATIGFGFIFLSLKKEQRFLKIMSVFMIVLVGLTRIYLGAHFPTDVLGGFILGLLILLGYRYGTGYVEKYLHHHSKFYQFMCHLSFALIILLPNFSKSSLSTLSFLCGATFFHLFLSRPTQGKTTTMKFLACFLGIIGLIALFKLPLPNEFKLIMTCIRSFVAGLWIGCSSTLTYLFIKRLRPLLRRF